MKADMILSRDRRRHAPEQGWTQTCSTNVLVPLKKFKDIKFNDYF